GAAGRSATGAYAYRAGGAGLVGILGLARGVPAGLLVPLITSWSDRVRRERLLMASVVPRALLLAAAAAAMTGGGQAACCDAHPAPQPSPPAPACTSRS